MGGFKQQSLNIDFQRGFFVHTVETLEKCCCLMKATCISTDRKIRNHEVSIQNHLFKYYLDNNAVLEKLGCDGFPISFQIETPETYDDTTDMFIGRCDIRVTSNNYWLNKDKEDYYIIECKRIDGSSNLNNKYVDEGISRFVEEPPKYPSHHGRNIMFGFVVQNISIDDNTRKISEIDVKKFGSKSHGAFVTGKSDLTEGLYEYASAYSLSTKVVELLHIFFDFSELMKVS
jgi:hypothetical protein